MADTNIILHIKAIAFRIAVKALKLLGLYKFFRPIYVYIKQSRAESKKKLNFDDLTQKEKAVYLLLREELEQSKWTVKDSK